MMPIIRLTDATFVDLRTIAAWLGKDSPSQTIDQLVKDKMLSLGLERDDEISTDMENTHHSLINSENTPSLTFTRILSAKINSKKLGKTSWSALLLKTIEVIQAKGISGEQLLRELQIPSKNKCYETDGYRFYPELGLSIQGQSTSDVWKEVSRIAKKFKIPVEVEFQWRENEKAMHPGRVGVVRAG